MRSGKQFAVVLVTAPDLKLGRRLAKLALEARLVACANILPKLESHYWWKEKIESGAEVLLLLKTARSQLTKLEKLIVAEHPYDTPEFVVLAVQAGNRRYLDWWQDAIR